MSVTSYNISVTDKEPHDAVKALTERLAQAERERDAALASAEGYRRDQKEATETALRNMAKAEAAEDRARRVVESGGQLRELMFLRNRIEALAKSWLSIDTVHVGRDYALALFALLQPPKAETALDVLSRIEKEACGAGSKHYAALQADMAKLRALLEREATGEDWRAFDAPVTPPAR